MKKKLNYKIIAIHSFYWLYELIEAYLWQDFVSFCVFYSFFIGTFYLHYYVIVPKMIKKPSFTSVLKWFLVFFLIFTARRYISNRILFDVLQPIGLYDAGDYSPSFIEMWKWIILGVISNSAGILAVSLGSRYVKNNSKLKDLKRQKVKNELSALKNQIDISETINILSKLEIKAKSKPDSIQEQIIQLSSVLRFHLYSKQGEILLFKELEVVQDQLDLFNELNQSNLKLKAEINDGIIKTGILSKAIGEVLKDNHKINFKLELNDFHDNFYLNISDSNLFFLGELKQRFENKFGNKLNIHTTNQSILIQLN